MFRTGSAVLWLALGSVVASGQTAGNCTVLTVAGSPTTDAGDGGPAVAAQLYSPVPMAADSAGRVYIADGRNYRVRKVAPDGTISTVAGRGVRGDDGDGGPARQARLMLPLGGAVDASGVVYIADWQAHRVRKVTPDGKISTIAGNGTAGFGGDGGPGTAAQLNGPRKVAVDTAGRVYIAEEWNDRIRQVDVAGTIRTVAGKGYLGSDLTPEQRGDGGPAADAAFVSVEGVAVDSAGNIYVSDPGDWRIRQIGTDGIIRTVVGPVNGYLNPAEGVPALSVQLRIISFAVYPNGPILLSESYQGSQGRLWRIGSDHLLHAVPGDLLLNGDLIVSPSGTIYQGGQNDQVWAIASGTFGLVAGAGTSGYRGDGGPATSAGLNLPWGLAGDRDGNLLIADLWSHRVRRVDSGGLINTIAGNGVTPYPYNDIGDEGPATAAALAQPRWLAVDNFGGLYIGDNDGHRIRKVDTDGIIHTIAGNGGDGSAGFPPETHPPLPATSVAIDVNGLAVDSLGTLFLADASRKGRFMNLWELGSIFKIAPDGTLTWFSEYQNPFAYNSGEGQLSMNGNDELFELKPHAFAVEKVAPDGLSTTPVARSGDFVWNQPRSFTYDRAGNLFVAGARGPIRKITPTGSVSNVFGGTSPNQINRDGPVFYNSTELSIMAMNTDEAGNLYFSDGTRSRVRMINTSTCQGAVYPLIAYLGIASSASNDYGPVAPGDMITISGANLGPKTPVQGYVGPDGRLVTSVGGARVLFDGVAAPLISVSATKVKAIVPYGVEGRASTQVVVEFRGLAGESNGNSVVDARPGIFTADGSGRGQAKALNADKSANGPGNPAAKGTSIFLYATGAGQTNPPGADGLVAGSVLPTPVLPVRVQIGGQEAVVQYAGAAPGLVAGMMVVKARVPDTITVGPAVPLVLIVGDKPSQQDVTIGVQ